jgi:polysaccharide biosynthesis protein PslH
MQILFATPRFPYPPDRGDRLRVYHLLRTLSSQHEITLVTFISKLEELDHIHQLASWCKEIQTIHLPAWRSLLQVGFKAWRHKPLQTEYYYSTEMQHLINRTLIHKPFDLIYVHLFRMAQYFEQNQGQYRILDLTDIISDEIERSLPYRNILAKPVFTREGRLIRKYENHLIESFNEIWLVSPSETQEQRKQFPQANIHCVPNGVDLGKFRPLKSGKEAPRLIFTGHMGVMHNIDAARHLVEDILPIVRQEIPNITLDIVGASPSRHVRALSKHPGVTITGYVEDLNSYLNRASMLVAPLRFAAGVQNKILEGMAAGLAVITTPLVNRGIEATVGKHLLLAENPVEISGMIIKLAYDEQLRQSLGEAARRFVKQNFHWGQALERVRQLSDRSS